MNIPLLMPTEVVVLAVPLMILIKISCYTQMNTSMTIQRIFNIHWSLIALHAPFVVASTKLNYTAAFNERSMRI